MSDHASSFPPDGAPATFGYVTFGAGLVLGLASSAGFHGDVVGSAIAVLDDERGGSAHRAPRTALRRASR